MPTRFIFVLLFLPNLVFASPNAERLQTIRIQAFKVCSNLLADYNPNQHDSDPRYAERYRLALQELEQLVVQEQEPLLIQTVKNMRQPIDELERHPETNPQLYPNWINPLLEAQARLDNQAAATYASLNVTADKELSNRLNLDIERLQLLYQTRTFGSLGVYVMEVDDNTFAQLDQRIVRGFAALEQQRPDQAVELGKLKSSYEFIRPRLLKHELTWVPGGAAYYLGKVSDGLARLPAK